MSLKIRTFAVVAMALGALAACSKDSTTTEPAATAATLVPISGLDVYVPVGGMKDTLSVFVGATNGDPLSGAVVTWQVASGDAALAATTSTTDASGIARMVLTSGTHAGSGTISVSTGTVRPATIYVAQAPGAAAKLVALEPTTDSLMVGDAFAPQLEVQDAYGNPVPGVTLVASEPTAMDGDAIVSPSVTTDANGVVQDTFVPANQTGARSLVFSTADGTLSITFTVNVFAPDDSGTTTSSVRAAALRHPQ
jgi:adhesin/invasin